MDPLDRLKRLSARIDDGEVVFFIGAGFSLDSEGNSADRLMRRLIVRFLAMVRVLQHHLSSSDSSHEKPNRDQLTLLLKNLSATFSLSTPQLDPLLSIDDIRWEYTQADVKALSAKYFEANDWFCGSFQRLLQMCCAATNVTGPALPFDRYDMSPLRELLRNISECENQLLRETESGDTVPFTPIDIRLFAWSLETGTAADRKHNAGKALFLETMGFGEQQIMEGDWECEKLHVPRSFQGKLFPRFHVLARLAREGLASTILTTNYDLLLEAAWRTAGFETETSQKDSWIDKSLMPTVPFRDMASIGKASEFFRYGRGSQTSNIVKVHGCVDLYRKAKQTGNPEWNTIEWLYIDDTPGQPTANEYAFQSNAWSAWKKYLPSLVFTFREIQNWREDSWARDYLATVQRTRTVAFAGYSLQDPVLHDTFRSVYEDMAKQRTRTDDQPDVPDMTPENAPAFFWIPGKGSSFYATEVLDSASAAVGHIRHDRGPHPNEIPFQFRSRDHNACFPDLDDQFLVLFHLMFRKQQLRCLESDLTQVASGLLRRVILKSDLDLVREEFQQQVKEEEGLLASLLKNSATSGNTQRQNQRICRDTVHWTFAFGSHLLREMAAIEILQRSAGPSVEIMKIRSPGWYLPSRSNRQSTAWSIVVELAIRRLFRSNVPQLEASPGRPTCIPVEGIFPEVQCRMPDAAFPGSISPDGINLRIVAGNSIVHRSQDLGPVRSHYSVEWILPPSRFPWPTLSTHDSAMQYESSIHPSLGECCRRMIAPAAEELWTLALKHDGSQEIINALSSHFSFSRLYENAEQ